MAQGGLHLKVLYHGCTLGMANQRNGPQQESKAHSHEGTSTHRVLGQRGTHETPSEEACGRSTSNLTARVLCNSSTVIGCAFHQLVSSRGARLRRERDGGVWEGGRSMTVSPAHNAPWTSRWALPQTPPRTTLPSTPPRYTVIPGGQHLDEVGQSEVVLE